MYIQPNTTVILLTGVPLDETYDHTIKFTSAQAQQTYFMSKQLMRFDQHTYQRKERGTIRVNALADNLYHVNYLMFQNTAFGNKWFYAFVRSVNYINDQTTEIVYAIDTYQTWLFEMQIGECFVEREHIVNDAIGASLTDEDLEVGDYEIVDTVDINGFGQDHSLASNYYLTIATTEREIAVTIFDEVETINSRSLVSGGCYYFYCNINRIYEFHNYIRLLSDVDKLDAIVSVFLLPMVVVDYYNRTGYPTLDTIFTVATPESREIGYQPKNKKLYQYPYNFLEVSDNCGESQIFKYEYFDKSKIYYQGNRVGFYFGCSISPTSELCLIPAYYNSNEDADIDPINSGFNNMLISSSIPRIPFSSDTYAVWLAQNSTWIGGHRIQGSEIINAKTAVNTVAKSAIAGAALGTKFGVNPATLGLGAGVAVLNVFNAVHDNFANREKAKMLPDKYNAGTGNVNLQYAKLGFTCYGMQIKQSMLRRIDSFFDMYGYKTNELKVPNMDSRPHWNFVKTTFANISGNIPADDIVKLKEIFNNGITFWKNPSEVGNYSLNNH